MMFLRHKNFQEVSSAVVEDFFSGDRLVWLWEVTTRTFYFIHTEQGAKGFSGKKRSWKSLIHPSERKNFAARLDQVGLSPENGDSFHFFHRIRLEPDGYQWVCSKIHVVDRDEAGRATRVIGISTNVAVLNRVREMSESFERARHALDAAEVGLWDWNVEASEVYYSPHYASMMGYDPEKFSQTLNSWASRVHQDDIEETMRLQYGYINSPEQGDVFESTFRFLAADGTYNWIMSHAKVVSRDENGRARRIVGLHVTVNKLRKTQETLTNIVNTDQLTQLASRLAFDTKLASLTEMDYPVSIIFMDVDGMKLVNDNLGHATGDSLLRSAANLIRQSFREKDLVARIGGDEFVALLPRCSMSVAVRLMRNIRSMCRKHNAGPDNLPVFLSAGLASTEQGIDLFQLQAMADRNMIRNKRKNATGHYAIILDWIGTHPDWCIQDTDVS